MNDFFEASLAASVTAAATLSDARRINLSPFFFSEDGEILHRGDTD
jgi:hypothetical protein